jgi:glutamate--cysteine ligase
VSTEASSPELSRPIRDIEDLEAYFHGGAKAREAWRVGVEYETPAVDATRGDALSYDEKRPCIREILEEYAGSEPSWEPVLEEGRIVALRDPYASITLEPGGQVEMSGRQCVSIHDANAEFSAHVERLTEVSERLGVRFLGLGATPKTPLENLPWMPKQRYRIMRRIMEGTGRLGHRMMQQTATVQANFDYSSEADARGKLRASMALSPVLIAMCANSAILDGRDTGFKSFRAHVWTDTDPARCGLLPFVFDAESLFHAYAAYALEVPMYFVARAGRFLPSSGMTFRHFLRHGLDGERATLADWATHLTTLFPESRLKTYLEVRSADGQPQDRVMAIPALLKGILYSDDAVDAVWALFRSWSLTDRREATEAAAKEGLSASVRRHTLLDYARDVLEIATVGLKSQSLRDAAGNDETVYLAALARDLAEGVSPADRVLAAWRGPWAGDSRALVDYAAYH